jgi:hypothetical protein
LALLWLLCGLLGATAAWSDTPTAAEAPGPALHLDGRQPVVDAWKALQVLPEDAGRMDLFQAMRRLDDFRAPRTPRGNLGVRTEGVWFRLALSVAADDDGRWLLDIDYPPLDRLDVFIVQRGVVLTEARLGDDVPYAERHMPARTHALPLDLTPGSQVEVWMRAETLGTLILPVSLQKHERYVASEARFQLLQGLAAGIALCMMM